jgi:hypothetical protein
LAETIQLNADSKVTSRELFQGNFQGKASSHLQLSEGIPSSSSLSDT